MSVIIRLEPLSINLETLSVFSFGLSAQPLSFIFVQEDLPEYCAEYAKIIAKAGKE